MVVLKRFPMQPRACDRRERPLLDSPLPGLKATLDEALREMLLDVRESVFIHTRRWN
jgi:hypothetical protein